MVFLRIDSGAGDAGGGRVMMVTVVWRFDKLGSSRKRHGFADKTYIRSNGFVGRTRSGNKGFVGKTHSGSNGYSGNNGFVGQVSSSRGSLCRVSAFFVMYYLHAALRLMSCSSRVFL